MNYTLHLALFAETYDSNYTAPVDYIDHEEYFEDLEELVDCIEVIEDYYSHDEFYAQVMGVTDDDNGYQDIDEVRFTVELGKLF